MRERPTDVRKRAANERGATQEPKSIDHVESPQSVVERVETSTPSMSLSDDSDGEEDTLDFLDNVLRMALVNGGCACIAV
jgi:hypothetical protein